MPAFGLHNNQAFCYLNSSMQCLFSIDDFFHFFKNSTFKDSQPYCQVIGQIVKKAVDHLRTQSMRALNLKSLQLAISKKFEARRQHDVHQFLRFLLVEIQEELCP